MSKFEIAHQRLVAACTARDSHEDPADPSTVQAMQIALHLPKQNPPGAQRGARRGSARRGGHLPG